MKLKISMGEESMMDPKEAMHHLMKAEEIKADPKLMALVEKEIATHKKKIKSISDIRKAASEFDPEAEDKKEKEAPEGSKKDLKEDKKEGETMDKKMTPDDHAEKEDKVSRVKNSKNPTMVGRQLK